MYALIQTCDPSLTKDEVHAIGSEVIANYESLGSGKGMPSLKERNYLFASKLKRPDRERKSRVKSCTRERATQNREGEQKRREFANRLLGVRGKGLPHHSGLSDAEAFVGNP